MLILQRFAGYTLGEADTVPQGHGARRLRPLMAEERGPVSLTVPRARALSAQFGHPGCSTLSNPFCRLRFQQGPQRQLCPLSPTGRAYFKGPLSPGVHVLGAELPAWDQHGTDCQLHQRVLQAPRFRCCCPTSTAPGEFFHHRQGKRPPCPACGTGWRPSRRLAKGR